MSATARAVADTICSSIASSTDVGEKKVASSVKKTVYHLAHSHHTSFNS